MFSQNNYWVSLALSIITMITWGSNKIAVKYIKYPVAMYTIDYFTWMLIFHVLLGFTVGAEWFPPDHQHGMISNFIDIIKKCTIKEVLSKFGGPILAGISTTAFSLIMFVITDGYGLTSSIPLLFGSAMLIGVIATYFMEPEGNPINIFSGVAILFFAVLLNTVASTMNNKRKTKSDEKALLEDDQEATTKKPIYVTVKKPIEVVESFVENPNEAVVEVIEIPKKQMSSMTLFIILGISGAIFDFFYAPCTAMGNKKPFPMTAYGIFLIVSIFAFLSVYPCAYIVMCFPLKGPTCTFMEYFQAPFSHRWPAIWSAGLLAIGNLCYALAGGSLGYAISYSLSRGTLLVSALWGILYYKEFKGANTKTWTLQLSALLFFVIAIVVVALAKSKPK